MKHLLKMGDLNKEQIIELLDLADKLKAENKAGIKHPLLSGKTLGMIFQKSSTRTRVSFEVGMYQLGGYPLFLSSNDLQIGRGEPVEDTARVLADLQTIREHKKGFDGLKMAYIGDGNNMANSLIVGGLTVGMEVACATPKDYQPDASVLEFAKDHPKFSISEDIYAAAKDADVLFTDVWASMGQEAQAEERRQAFQGIQINRDVMAAAKPDAMVQHCLPAHRGEEITAEIFEEHAQEIFDEAENRLHAQKAVMVKVMGGK